VNLAYFPELSEARRTEGFPEHAGDSLPALESCQSFRCPAGSGALGGCLNYRFLSSIRGADAVGPAADR